MTSAVHFFFKKFCAVFFSSCFFHSLLSLISSLDTSFECFFLNTRTHCLPLYIDSTLTPRKQSRGLPERDTEIWRDIRFGDMGKRKSKVAKAKQAKAKKNHASSKFGVSAVKSNKFSQQVTDYKLNIEGNGSSNMEIQASAISKKLLHKPRPKKVFLSHSPVSTRGAKNINDEQEDFRKQMASLQERQAASRKAPQRQKKSELLKEGGAVSNIVQGFQPASFSLDKTTADLLHETVHQMQGMSGVGQAAPPADSLPTPIRNNKSWAKPVKEGLKSKNPFAALEEEDDSDNEFTGMATGRAGRSPTATTLQIAPASFTLLPRTTPTPATTPLRESTSPSSVTGISTLTGISVMPNAGDGNDDDGIDPDL